MSVKNIYNKDLPNTAHVVRYVKPTKIFEDGSVDGSEFYLRPHEAGLSVNWIECFGNHITKIQQLNEVRRLSRISMKKSGCLAELNVGETKQHIRSESINLRFINRPLEATEDYEEDPSHSEIMGLPIGDSAQAALLGQMIAECVKDTHPTVRQ